MAAVDSAMDAVFSAIDDSQLLKAFADADFDESESAGTRRVFFPTSYPWLRAQYSEISRFVTATAHSGGVGTTCVGSSSSRARPMLPTAARHTMAALTPSAHHLSPAVGLALSAGGAHLVTRLYDLHQSMPIADGAHGMTFDGKAVRIKSSAASELARGLFHRNHLDEPLQPTTNRSLPGAHLSASGVRSVPFGFVIM